MVRTSVPELRTILGSSTISPLIRATAPLTGLAVIALVLCAFPISGQYSDREDGSGAPSGLQLSVSAEKTQLDMQSRVVLEVRLVNLGEGRVSVFNHLMWGHAGGLTLHVVNEQGQSVTASQLDHDMVVPSTLRDAAF